MNVYTTGQIAKALDADRDHVSYAIRKSNIQPIGRAGNVRLFSKEAVEPVRQFLERKKGGNREG